MIHRFVSLTKPGLMSRCTVLMKTGRNGLPGKVLPQTLVARAAAAREINNRSTSVLQFLFSQKFLEEVRQAHRVDRTAYRWDFRVGVKIRINKRFRWTILGIRIAINHQRNEPLNDASFEWTKCESIFLLCSISEMKFPQPKLIYGPSNCFAS